MTAPSPAPASVPIPAPSAVFRPGIRCGVVPASRDAQSRHTTSSVWNCSNDLPVPGSAITLGPLGTVAQALNSRLHIRTMMYFAIHTLLRRDCDVALL